MIFRKSSTNPKSPIPITKPKSPASVVETSPVPITKPNSPKKNKKSHLLTFILFIYLLTGFSIGILSLTGNITYH